jgi:EmrB/QacA subfamily drug resistance transporter
MTKSNKLVLVVSILASFVAFLDGSIINVALPAMSEDLGGGLTIQQWIVDAYLLTLGSLILLAGSVSDIFGRKKVLSAGLIGFGITSLLCALAPTGTFLIAARALQGAAGALLVPSSLALIMSTFSGEAKGRAIGLWTAWTGMAFIIGPLLGGILVDTGSWRWIFAINILPIAVTLWLMRGLKNDPKPVKGSRVDWFGGGLGILALGGPVFALIEQPKYGWGHPLIFVPMAVGLLAMAGFLWHERRATQPMLPLTLFSNRNFSVGNLATIAIYGGLSVATFLIVVFVQQVAGYSALQAGLSLVPITLIMFFLSGRFGSLAGRYGPRLFMSLGPFISAFGFLLLFGLDETIDYWTQLFPGVVVFGFGLSVTVAPLTMAILGSIEEKHSGVASAVNNAVSRIAGLVAIALVGLVTGPELDVDGFQRGVIVMALLVLIGGVISAIGIRNGQATNSTVSQSSS